MAAAAAAAAAAEVSQVVQLSQRLLDGCSAGDLDAVQSAIADGASLQALDPVTGESALLKAVRQYRLDIMRALVVHGADVNTCDYAGVSPLHVAASVGEAEYVKFLLGSGAVADVADAEGRTPLDIAQEKAHLVVLLALVQHGATGFDLRVLLQNRDLRAWTKDPLVKAQLKALLVFAGRRKRQDDTADLFGEAEMSSSVASDSDSDDDDDDDDDDYGDGDDIYDAEGPSPPATPSPRKKSTASKKKKKRPPQKVTRKMDLDAAVAAIAANSAVRVNLNFADAGNRGLRAIAAALAANTSLKDLLLKDSQIGGPGEGVAAAAAFGAALASNTGLERLGLGSNPLGDSGVAPLTTALESNRTLRELWLDRTQITDRTVNLLASALCYNQSIVKINLRRNLIGDGGAQSLATIFAVNRKLNTVMLGGNRIGSEGAKSLLSALVGSRNRVRRLELSDNDIDDVGGEFVLSYLRKRGHCKLRELSLQGNRISPPLLDAIAQALAAIQPQPKAPAPAQKGKTKGKTAAPKKRGAQPVSPKKGGTTTPGRHLTLTRRFTASKPIQILVMRPSAVGTGAAPTRIVVPKLWLDSEDGDEARQRRCWDCLLADVTVKLGMSLAAKALYLPNGRPVHSFADLEDRITLVAVQAGEEFRPQARSPRVGPPRMAANVGDRRMIVRIHRNGQYKVGGGARAIVPDTWAGFLAVCTAKLDYSLAARRVFSPTTGAELSGLADLEDGVDLVVSTGVDYISPLLANRTDLQALLPHKIPSCGKRVQERPPVIYLHRQIDRKSLAGKIKEKPRAIVLPKQLPTATSRASAVEEDKHWNMLLAACRQRLGLPWAAKSLYRLSGSPITRLSDIVDGMHVIVSMRASPGGAMGEIPSVVVFSRVEYEQKLDADRHAMSRRTIQRGRRVALPANWKDMQREARERRRAAKSKSDGGAAGEGTGGNGDDGDGDDGDDDDDDEGATDPQVGQLMQYLTGQLRTPEIHGMFGANLRRIRRLGQVYDGMTLIVDTESKGRSLERPRQLRMFSIKIRVHPNGRLLKNAPTITLIHKALNHVLDECRGRLRMPYAARRLFTPDGLEVREMADFANLSAEAHPGSATADRAPPPLDYLVTAGEEFRFPPGYPRKKAKVAVDMSEAAPATEHGTVHVFRNGAGPDTGGRELAIPSTLDKLLADASRALGLYPHMACRLFLVDGSELETIEDVIGRAATEEATEGQPLAVFASTGEAFTLPPGWRLVRDRLQVERVLARVRVDAVYNCRGCDLILNAGFGDLFVAASKPGLFLCSECLLSGRLFPEMFVHVPAPRPADDGGQGGGAYLAHSPVKRRGWVEPPDHDDDVRVERIAIPAAVSWSDLPVVGALPLSPSPMGARVRR